MREIKLIHGDCLEVIDRLISDGVKVDAIITDPPYEVSINGGGSVNNIKKLNKTLQPLKDLDIVNGYDIDLFADKVVKLFNEGINLYIYCNKNQIPKYFNTYANRMKCKFQIISWHKPNALPTYSNKYLSDTEYCLNFFKGKGKCFPSNYEDAKTYFIDPINHKDKKKYEHPTIKYIHHIERFVKNSTREGQIVLDPFMGSGSTGVACINTKRNFIGIEKDDKYFEIAKKRIEEAQNGLC